MYFQSEIVPLIEGQHQMIILAVRTPQIAWLTQFGTILSACTGNIVVGKLTFRDIIVSWEEVWYAPTGFAPRKVSPIANL